VFEEAREKVGKSVLSKLRIPTTLLAVGALALALLYAPAADTAPGDSADLTIVKSDSPDPVLVDGLLTYTIQVGNLGPQAATEVVVTDDLPSHVTYVSASASSGACTRKGKQVTCNVGALAVDPTKANAITVTIQVRPTKVETIVNTASVDSVENDPVATNDKAQASTRVTAAAQAPSCRGTVATLVGTAGPDRLVGTEGPDVILARAGGDTIVGLSGRDLICGNSGSDRVNAGPAADRVFAGAGTDRVKGRGGPDLLVGNANADVLAGNAGDDRLRGGRGFDLCYGGAGFDRERGCER
jgi:uncharacterized repeat protein (TIGR01451 family)